MTMDRYLTRSVAQVQDVDAASRPCPRDVLDSAVANSEPSGHRVALQEREEAIEVSDGNGSGDEVCARITGETTQQLLTSHHAQDDSEDDELDEVDEVALDYILAVRLSTLRCRLGFTLIL